MSYSGTWGVSTGSHHDIFDRKTLVTGPHLAANSKAPRYWYCRNESKDDKESPHRLYNHNLPIILGEVVDLLQGWTGSLAISGYA